MLFQKNAKSEQNNEPLAENTVRPLWQRAALGVGEAGANVLAGTFNAIVVAGALTIGLSQYSESGNPLDGLNNILTDKNIEMMEQRSSSVLAADYYTNLLPQKQYTFFGDTNHTVGGIRDYFFGVENTQQIIDADVKHVMIEYPESMQGLAESLSNGALTKDQFIDEITAQIKPLWWSEEQTRHYHSLMADMIVTLNDHGVKMHFVDPGLGESGMGADSKELLFEIAGELVGLLSTEGVDASMSSMEIFIATQKFVYSKLLSDDGFEARLEKLYKDFFEQRLGEDNKRIAANIQDIAGDERAVILYGAAHIMREHDLDEMLGEDKTQNISLYSDKHSYADALMGAIYSFYLPEKPSRIHIITEQNVYEDQKASVAPHYQPRGV
jgi:hypothetical protein